jgi:hypothetical protein
MMEVNLHIPLLITLAFIVLVLLRLSYPPGLKTSRSDTRGLELLKNWLSPEQLTSYEQCKYFDVIGSDSRTVFRIHHGTQMNVTELDSIGQPACRWCFAPHGSLVAGDVMLTQKIALETNERGVLAVANRSLTH